MPRHNRSVLVPALLQVGAIPALARSFGLQERAAPSATLTGRVPLGAPCARCCNLVTEPLRSVFEPSASFPLCSARRSESSETEKDDGGPYQ